MKKLYSKPEMIDLQMQAFQMIAESIPSSDDYADFGDACSREDVGFDDNEAKDAWVNW